MRVLNSVLILASSLAAVSAPTSPRSTVDQFFLAIEGERWHEAATLIDSGAFSQFLQMRIDRARVELPPPTRQHPSKHGKSAGAVAPRDPGFQDYSREFSGVHSFQMLRSLSPLEAAARWLQANDPVSAYMNAVFDDKCRKVPVDREKVRATNPFRRVTVAEAIVGDSLAYVLAVRVAPSSTEPFLSERPSVLTLKKREGRWLLVTQSDLLGSSELSFVIAKCSD